MSETKSAEPSKEQSEKARAFIRNHNDATCVDACAAELARLLAAEAALLREERDRLAHELAQAQEKLRHSAFVATQNQLRKRIAENAELQAKVAERDARIATLTKLAEEWEAHSEAVFDEQPHTSQDYAKCAKQLRAALGAPEGLLRDYQKKAVEALRESGEGEIEIELGLGKPK